MTTRPKWLRRRRRAEMQQLEYLRRTPRRWVTKMTIDELAISGSALREEIAKISQPKRMGW